MRITSRRVIAALAAIAWFLPLAMRIEAQTVTGTILGTVSDTSGAHVAGAGVGRIIQFGLKYAF